MTSGYCTDEVRRGYVFVGSRACAANHYVIAEKCPVCPIFGERVDYAFVNSRGKCRNAHGIVGNRNSCLQLQGVNIFVLNLYSRRYGDFLTNAVLLN